MAKVLVTESYLEDIADEIRGKLGVQTEYKPSQMAGAIAQIDTSGVTEPISITNNGTYYPPSGVDGFSQVDVNVSGGGTNIPIIARADWNLLTTAEKQAYGYVCIQDAQTGFLLGDFVNGAEYSPYHDGVHIWTKSIGGNDAAMYVQNGYWDDENNQFVATGEVVSVIYTSVRGTTTYDCNGVATLGYPSNWQVYATDAVTDGTNTYSSGDLVKDWSYNVSVDFYIYKAP